ncbi:hypothetical protein HY641_03360 [Candidatus Woesearchaeota archaeon]|nr:hypothetical protein [Candidatus Woesearchaeota archaeon]
MVLSTRTTAKGSSRTRWLANPLPAQPTTIIDETGRGYQVQTETGRAVVKTLDNKLIQDTARQSRAKKCKPFSGTREAKPR